MNINTLHSEKKTVSSKPLFTGDIGTVLALHIAAGEQLSENITRKKALLLCVKGNVYFRNVEGIENEMHPGDCMIIEPDVKHWLDAKEDSDLVLIK